ncbi:MAG: hypothetical protein AAGD47_01060 [Pseudomonadota bacterium]
MGEIDLNKLRCLVAGFPAEPPRTKALEQKIQIGAGFHDKWYRSQKEHWLGWLTAKSRENELDEKTFDPPRIWSGLKCSPMLFWMAEVAGAEASVLDRLETVSIEAARVKPQDGNPHGVAFRKILPWPKVEELLPARPGIQTEEVAHRMGDEALERLANHVPRYRRLLRARG